MNHGSPGVAIEVIDNSGYSVIDDPNIIAGIVGFSTKGEFNTLIDVTNTSEQDTLLGYGYNNPKYNMGLYGTRAVLNAGGHVQYVRPYGEAVSSTDKYAKELKSDAFVVAYDKNAAQYTENKTSFNIRHFATTRYESDGFSKFGGKRKINNISETIATNKNIDFSLNADSDWWEDNDAARSETDTVLFSMINTDPTLSTRAADRYDVNDVEAVSGYTTRYQLSLGSNASFSVGDTIFIPSTETSVYDINATVISIDDNIVVIDLESIVTSGFNPDAIFCNNDDTNTGVDYLSIRTATANKAVKKLGKLTYTSAKSGDSVVFYTPDHLAYTVRMLDSTALTLSDVTGITYDSIDKIYTLTSASLTNLVTVAGDIVTLAITVSSTTSTYTATVLSQSATGIIFSSIKNSSDVEVSAAISSITAINIVLKTLIGDATANIEKITVSEAAWTTSAVYLVENKSITTTSGTSSYIVLKVGTTYGDYTANISVGDHVNLVGTTTTSAYVKTASTITDTSSVVYTILTFSDYNDTTLTVTDNDVYHEIASITFNESNTNVGDYINNAYSIYEVNTNDLVIFNSGSLSALTTDVEYVNITATLRNIADSVEAMEYTVSGGISNTIQAFAHVENTSTTFTLPNGTAVNYTIGDLITFVQVANDTDASWSSANTISINNIYPITAINTYTDKITVGSDIYSKFDITNSYIVLNLTASPTSAYINGMLNNELVLVGRYSLNTASVDQKGKLWSTLPATITGSMSTYGTYEDGTVQETEKVLTDSDIGISFMNLGLATVDYLDVEFSGDEEQVYTLTDDGETIARMYLYVTYMLNGNEYEFDGTIVPYVYNDTQLYIGDSADNILDSVDAKFVLNDSGILDTFIENNSYDLSQSIKNDILTSTFTKLAYDENDPAIIYDAIWSYSPANNKSSTILSTAWNLFLNKDTSDVGMLVAAGTGINNLFVKGKETLDFNVIDAMLEICELRKDCFAICDGVGESDIKTTIKKLIGIGSSGIKSRWGALYDGRSVFYDSLYTKTNVEIVKSIQVASIISSNRAGGTWWLVPAGQENGIVPAAWGTREKYPRTYNYAEDKNSDIAKLTQIHANPTRKNSSGQFIWGDFTMQKADTAFNQIHVAMLIAGIHKKFYKYLDKRVFKLNTANLRADIHSDLQGSLDLIKGANPSGLYSGTCICDDTNNTTDIIDRNELIVDIKIKPTKSSRYITLRTTVESTGTSNTVTSTLV